MPIEKRFNHERNSLVREIAEVIYSSSRGREISALSKMSWSEVLGWTESLSQSWKFTALVRIVRRIRIQKFKANF